MAGSGCNAYQIRKIYAIGGALGMVKRNEEDDLLHELVEGMTGKKSIKADQIKGGEDAVRNVQQSALRGGEFGLTFISFNPPAASRNWANRYAREERKGKRVHHSTYLQAPAAWLGPKFLAQAEYIKETQPTKYRHEYLGEVVGSGTQVFENLRLEPISQKTIRNFDTIENGVDWGWYPDPWAFNRCHYDHKLRRRQRGRCFNLRACNGAYPPHQRK